MSFIVGFSLHARAEAYKWSVQYLIDNSQTVFGRSQRVSPRHNRALAISPDLRYLYAGYHHSFNGNGEVRKIDLTVPDYENATLGLISNVLAKALAVDDAGHVYIADVHGIHVYDPDLLRMEYTILIDGCEGLTAAREGKTIVLYGSERYAGTIFRWEIETKGRDVIGANLAGFGDDGECDIKGAVSLRGLAIDSKQRIWVADLTGNKVYRVEHDGTHLTSVDIKSPMAIAFDGQKCFVTQYLENQISILDPDMQIQGTLSVPWDQLELAPLGNNHDGALSGIVTIPGKGFYVANEAGQTANQKSTYGRPDENTDFVGGKLYMDAFLDDNEPILHATPAELQQPAATPPQQETVK